MNTRALEEGLLIGDIISCWEILKKIGNDPVLFSRLYLGLKFIPIQEEDIVKLQREIFFEQLYDFYFKVSYLEDFNFKKAIGLIL